MQLQGDDAALWSAGVDYLTLTSKWDNPALTALRLLWTTEMQRAADKEATPNVTSPQGYKGYQTKHLFMGERQDGLMFRASGLIADFMVKECSKHGGTEKATRIDLEATTRTADFNHSWLQSVRRCVTSGEGENRAAKRRARGYFENCGSGDSFTSGSRVSSRYLRIYDKTAEQRGKVDAGLLRYELELKRKQAQAVYRMLTRHPDTEFYAKGFLMSELAKLGIDVPWCRDSEALQLPSTFEETDEERRYAWLKHHVAPVYQKIRDPEMQRDLRRLFKFYTE